ncbi:MAG: sulfatase [Myxococcota bacterium]
MRNLRARHSAPPSRSRSPITKGQALPFAPSLRAQSLAATSLLVALGAVSACDCSSEEDSSGDPIANDETASHGYGDLLTHLDLLATPHLADIDHHGTYIDFGTPSRMKYTVGHWRTGWTSDEAEGERTFSHVGATGRLFFELDEAGPITLRFRMKPVGSRNLTLFLNNHQQELVRMEGDGFANYDVSIPSDHVRAGENYMLMRFGGTERVGGHDVSAAVESIRIVPGDTVTDDGFDEPVFSSLLADATVGGATRPSILSPRPGTLSFYVQVPRGGARLGFGVGLPDGGSTPVAVRATPEGGSATELFAGTAAETWTTETVDLTSHEGTIVRLDFVGNDSGTGRVAWSRPQILLDRPTAADNEPAKNVVVLLIDTLRAEKLRPWNPNSRVETPVLDRLAAAGTVFEHAQSPENWTKPSCASVLTGLYPDTHQAKTSEARLSDSAVLLSEHLQSQGFRTGSFIANGYVSDRFGFDQGWNHYTNFIREEKNTDAENVFREAAEWIEANKDERFFAYIQTIDPHVPYDPPENFLRMYDRRDYQGQVQPRATPDLLEQAKRNPPGVTFDGSDRRRLRALHDGEISYHDQELGRFVERLEALGVWDSTLLVVTSDHGEEFNEHGSWGHGHSVYQELLHVPLMFHRPGLVPEGLRVSETVSTLDIPGTVLTAVRGTALPADEGRNLTGFMHGTTPPGPSVAFSDFLDDRRVIRAGRWKLVLRGINATLFDLEADPGEQRELDRTDHPIAMRFLRIHLGQFLGASDRSRWMDYDQGAGTNLQRQEAEMDDTIRDQLRALGYAN